MLDMKTLFMMTSGIGGVMAFGLIYISLTRKTYAGFRCWAISGASYFGASLLIGLRGEIPVLLSIVLGNMLAVGAVWLISMGLLRFIGKKVSWMFLALPVIIVGIIQSYYAVNAPDLGSRIIVASIGIILPNAIMLVVLRRTKAEFLKGHTFIVPVIMVATIAWSIVRIVMISVAPSVPPDFLHTGPVEQWSVLVYGLLFLAMMFGLTILYLQRVEYDLVAALSSVRQLEGILPICAGCKRIRDECGDWHQVEQYVQDRTQAAFTHGFCPECSEKYFPDS